MSIVAASIPISKRRFNVKKVLAWWPVLPLAVFVLLAVVGPSLVPFDPERALAPVSTPPNATYLFGTDRSGMDVFSRTIVATRLNLTIAVSVTLFATVAGSVLGMALGMNESKRGVAGFVARGASRTLDLVQAVPVLLIGLVAVAFFGRNSGVMIVTIAVLLLPNQARLVRNETLRVRSEAYLDAARLAGASELTLTRRHVLPNAIGPAINNMSVISALAIIITAGLGFVGAGVQPPTPEWGTMLSIGSPDVQAGRWWAAFFPAAFLALCVAAVSMANGVFMRQRRR
jgi:peptide/nickel transport system permease protein